MGQWTLDSGPHSHKQSRTTLGNPCLVHDQGLRKVLDVIGEDPQQIGLLPSTDILLQRECQQLTLSDSPLTDLPSRTPRLHSSSQLQQGSRAGEWVGSRHELAAPSDLE